MPLAEKLHCSLRRTRQAARRRSRSPPRSPPRLRSRARSFRSWGHAVIHWADGTSREGWLRAGDGMDFTPAAAFGPDLAKAAGATFILD
ncbi:MAG TPA: hypothetical protein VG142_18000 [Trebonia sp.]|nr:hypothetical protein [Trebonia sp.]